MDLRPLDLNLLLVGGPELLLRLPRGLADRLTARCLLGPLSESESASYVLGRLAASGATGPLFPDDALAALDVHLTDDEVATLEAPYRPDAPAGF